jgi:hypothetical protein
MEDLKSIPFKLQNTTKQSNTNISKKKLLVWVEKETKGPQLTTERPKKILECQLSYQIIDLIHILFQIEKKEPIKIKEKVKKPTEENKQKREMYNNKDHYFQSYYSQLSQWKMEENVIDWKKDDKKYTNLISQTRNFFDRFFLLSTIEQFKFSENNKKVGSHFQDLSQIFFVFKNQPAMPTIFSQLKTKKNTQLPKSDKNKKNLPNFLLWDESYKFSISILQVLLHLDPFCQPLKTLSFHSTINYNDLPAKIFLMLKMNQKRIFPFDLLKTFQDDSNNIKSLLIKFFTLKFDSFFSSKIIESNQFLQDLFQISYNETCE